MSGDRISDEAVKAAICHWFNDPSGNSLDLTSPEMRDWPRRMRNALSAALPLLEGGKGEPVAWMVRNTDTGELHWNEELCVFADAASADEMAECLNDNDSPTWEAFPLYTGSPVLPKQITVVSRNLPDGPVWMALAELDEQRRVYVTLDPMYAHPKVVA